MSANDFLNWPIMKEVNAYTSTTSSGIMVDMLTTNLHKTELLELSDINVYEKAISQAIKKGFVMDFKRYYAIGKSMEIFLIIFSHNFAKAFWGEELGHICCCDDISCEGWIKSQKSYQNYLLRWQYHLSRMVLEEKPLSYIKKFLK